MLLDGKIRLAVVENGVRNTKKAFRTVTSPRNPAGLLFLFFRIGFGVWFNKFLYYTVPLSRSSFFVQG
jgi:hypothetical protein